MTTHVRLLLAAVALTAGAVAVALSAPAAHADGDPASDYLLGRRMFVPPEAGISAPYTEQLAATIREAHTRGYTIRVALISSRYDLGSVTALYGKPKLYARFLGQELAIVYHDRLLVVMPDGLGVSRNGKALLGEQAVVDRIDPPGANGVQLTTAATRAVVRLAASAGVVFPTPRLPRLAAPAHARSTATRDRITIAAAGLVGVALAAAAVFFRRRRS